MMGRDTTKGMTKEQQHLVDDAITKFIKRNIAEVEFWLAHLGLAVREPKISAEEFQKFIASQENSTLSWMNTGKWDTRGQLPSLDRASPTSLRNGGSGRSEACNRLGKQKGAGMAAPLASGPPC